MIEDSALAREYADASYQPKIFIFALLIGACNFPIQAAITWIEMDASAAGYSMRMIACAPLILCSLFYYMLSVLFRSHCKYHRAVCKKQYDWFRLQHIIAGSLASLWAKVSIEVHRSTYGFTDPTQSHLKLEYSIGSRFVRTCIDTYPERTWMIKKISDHSLGCANAVLGADMMCLCWFANLLPIVFSM